ncbi:sulfurtransferase complex subunit TusB [Bowmanella pacifica]|uniref:Sulfurtransferase complex subunit TusB n=1 Tax=Bowmanella pacifica TaxID=502051 RepID=A0A917YY04_9ALTE|nr:sulfurtransferase complex subunit TusB [Bowmanella pacifica]GGO69264.1 hypothetical protein GCM10010982_20040 [Bowmanella pacifica]
MILHLLRASPFSDQSLCQCLGRVTEQDGIVLMQDAVYALRGQEQAWYNPMTSVSSLYALKEDIEARGISAPEQVHVIGYPELVTLTLKFDNVISW